jgi:hypothetical protein
LPPLFFRQFLWVIPKEIVRFPAVKGEKELTDSIKVFTPPD